jgi:hypothetical protein
VEHASTFNFLGLDTLRTYTPVEPIKVIYFDGFSAVKSQEGTYDLQIALGLGAEKIPQLHPLGSDTEIANSICDLVKPLGIGALIRMQLVWEMVYCDCSDGGLELIRSKNIWDPSGE